MRAKFATLLAYALGATGFIAGGGALAAGVGQSSLSGTPSAPSAGGISGGGSRGGTGVSHGAGGRGSGGGWHGFAGGAARGFAVGGMNHGAEGYRVVGAGSVRDEADGGIGSMGPRARLAVLAFRDRAPHPSPSHPSHPSHHPLRHRRRHEYPQMVGTLCVRGCERLELPAPLCVDAVMDLPQTRDYWECPHPVKTRVPVGPLTPSP